ncbi:MAG: hypothetical protein DWQ01_07370 [Planctomycetota bacterium]|nr:MAG: hypothetical protein DWQ01_07370 [Planctomycetota bacterium]
MISIVCLATFIFAPQDVPLARGAYRGPYDEVLREQAAAAESEDSESKVLLDAWDRWEFWFEFQREILFRGLMERPGAAVQNDRYGPEDWALGRQEALEVGQPVLLRALDSKFPVIREAAALALGRMGSNAAVNPLKRALGDSSSQVRQAALLGLGLIGDEDSVLALAGVFRNPSHTAGMRAFAALGLGLSGRPEAGDLVDSYLKRNLKPDRVYGEEETVLSGAVWAAGILPAPGLTVTLLRGAEELRTGAASGSRKLRTVLFQALGNRQDRLARPYLIESLNSQDLAQRRSAALALGSLGDPAAIPALQRAFLAGGDLETRMFALLSAGQIGGHQAVAWLNQVGPETVKHRQLRSAWSLAVGMAQVGPELETLRIELTGHEPNQAGAKVRRDEERLRGAVAVGLGLFGDRRTLADIQESMAVKGLDPDFAGYLAIGAGALGGSQATQYLLKLSRQEGKQVDFTRGLVLGLGLVKDPRAAAEITRCLLEETHPEVQWAASRALGLVRSRKAFQTLITALSEEGEVRREPENLAAMIRALGFLTDVRRGESVGSFLRNMNYRQDFRMLRVLRAY